MTYNERRHSVSAANTVLIPATNQLVIFIVAAATARTTKNAGMVRVWVAGKTV